MNDKFWDENPNILFNTSRLKFFFPNKNMSFNEQLNTYTRLSFYISIILFIYSGKYHYLFIFIFTIIITFLIHKNLSKKDKINKQIEKFGKYFYPTKYIYPTKNNPFMNINLLDYKNNPNRDTAYKIHDSNKKNIDKQINNKFNINLYRDLDDIYEKNNSQRQFYTTPITTIPNNQDKFARWLYNIDKTCKEGNGNQCVKNNFNPTYYGNREV